MSTIVVTGGSGVIGRALVPQLQASGHELVVVDRRPPNPALCVGWRHDRVHFVEMDVRSTDRLTAIVSNAESVVHLAASSSILDFEEDPITSYRNTVDAATSVAQAVRASPQCRTLVSASTAAVYEGQSLPYSEDQPTSPPDLKASAKSLTEKVFRDLHETCGANVTVLRPFSVYSEYEMDKATRANVLSLFAWATARGFPPVIWGDGTQTRDFVHADDAALAFSLALDAADGYCLFNVCTGVETSFVKALQILGEVAGQAINPVHVEIQLPIYARRLLGMPTKTANRIGFRASISVAEGLRRIWETANTTPYRDMIPVNAYPSWFRRSKPNTLLNANLREPASPVRSAG